MQADESKEQVIRKPLRDFVGLEGTDDGVIKAMANFSYLSAIGNMDEAFKAIKAIKRYRLLAKYFEVYFDMRLSE